MNEPLNHELLSFIGKSPTVFHAVDTMKAQLAEAGFIPVSYTHLTYTFCR